MKRIPTLATLAGIAAMSMTSGAQTKPVNVLFIAVENLHNKLIRQLQERERVVLP